MLELLSSSVVHTAMEVLRQAPPPPPPPYLQRPLMRTITSPARRPGNPGARPMTFEEREAARRSMPGAPVAAEGLASQGSGNSFRCAV